MQLSWDPVFPECDIPYNILYGIGPLTFFSRPGLSEPNSRVSCVIWCVDKQRDRNCSQVYLEVEEVLDAFCWSIQNPAKLCCYTPSSRPSFSFVGGIGTMMATVVLHIEKLIKIKRRAHFLSAKLLRRILSWIIFICLIYNLHNPLFL